MSKLAIGLLVSVVVAGNVITSVLLLGLRDSGPVSELASVDDGDAAAAALHEAIDSLREDVNRLSLALASRPSSSRATTDPAESGGGDLAARFDEVIERLEALEKSIAAKNEASDDLAAFELREKRQEQFRSEDGFAVAEELLAEKKFVVGANGILTFLESHPDHPDAQDLMRRARSAFLQSGYLDKALWMQDEIMKKFPEHRGGDLYQLGMLEKRMKKFDDATRHLDESVGLATTDPDRMKRLFGRAELVHERDGDRAGLEAYREVERLATAAGTGPAGEAGKRADSIEERLGTQ